jgi:ankyrin repeat protein
MQQLSWWVERYGSEGPMTYAEAVAMSRATVPNRARSLRRFLTKLVRGRWCAEPGDVEMLAGLISREPALVMARDADGQTPLHHLMAQIRPDSTDAEVAVFEALAERTLIGGSDPNAKDKNGFTPLFLASTPRAAVFLVQRGARVNEANNQGNTALMHAVHDQKLFDALLTLGADPHQANCAGKNAYTWSLLVRKEES